MNRQAGGYGFEVLPSRPREHVHSAFRSHPQGSSGGPLPPKGSSAGTGRVVPRLQRSAGGVEKYPLVSRDFPGELQVILGWVSGRFWGPPSRWSGPPPAASRSSDRGSDGRCLIHLEQEFFPGRPFKRSTQTNRVPTLW